MARQYDEEADALANSESTRAAGSSALAQEDRPLHERISDIARDASRLKRGKRGCPVNKREVNKLWGNFP
jgi:hypothetical protein